MWPAVPMMTEALGGVALVSLEAMRRSQIEFEVREPTGLGLGTYDIFMIRQKIYTGEFHGRCEFLDASDRWTTLAQHPAFADVYRLLLETGRGDKKAAGPKVAPRIAGWQSTGDGRASDAPGTALLSRPEPEETRRKAKGILGRFFGRKD
jgi:hypothetical protein